MVTYIDVDVIDGSEGQAWGAATDLFFADGTPSGDATQASFLRIHGRMILGAAAGFTGATAGNNGLTGSWLQEQGVGNWGDQGTTLQYFESQARFACVNDLGRIAGTFATRADGTDGDGGIALALAYVNNGNDTSVSGHTIYMEAIRENMNAGMTTGIELDVVNKVPTQTAGVFGAYGSRPVGSLVGLTIASGADVNVNPSSFPADCAMEISNNGNTFMSGIIIKHDAIEREGATATPAKAIVMGARHQIVWEGEDDEPDEPGIQRTPAFRMWSEISHNGFLTDIIATDTMIKVQNSIGNPLFEIGHVVDADAHVRVLASDGGSPQVRAEGSATDLDLRLEPKGTGHVRFGAHSASGDVAVSGFVEIKDAGGTTRKLAVIT